MGELALSINGIIKNCHNYANIVSETSAGACGGISGYSTGADILDCSNKGKIEGSNGFIAGISGYAWATEIYNCYNEGEINTTAHAAAGIVGYCQTSWLDKCYNIRKCTSKKLYWWNNC